MYAVGYSLGGNISANREVDIDFLPAELFRSATVYWEGEDEDGEANGEFTPNATGRADPAWIAYIVAER